MFTVTMDYWKLGLIVVAVMMLGYLIIQTISWGIDALLHRKKKIKEPPKQSKLIIDVPGPSDDIQMKNLENWVSDLDDTVQYFTSEFIDAKENFESFKQDVDGTISEQTERINKLEDAAKDEIDNMYRRVRIAELGIDKLEDRVNAIEHDIGDAFEEIHNNANEIDCVRRDKSAESGMKFAFDTLGEAIKVLANMRKTLSTKGYLTLIDLRNEIGDRPFTDGTEYGWIDLDTAYINCINRKYFVNLPNLIKLFDDVQEVPDNARGFIRVKDAIKVLNRMRDEIDIYGFATVEDFKQACGMDDTCYLDKKYGWTDLSQAYIARNDYIYYVVLPKQFKLCD